MRKEEVYFARDKKSVLYKEMLETMKRSGLSHTGWIEDHAEIKKDDLKR